MYLENSKYCHVTSQESALYQILQYLFIQKTIIDRNNQIVVPSYLDLTKLVTIREICSPTQNINSKNLVAYLYKHPFYLSEEVINHFDFCKQRGLVFIEDFSDVIFVEEDEVSKYVIGDFAIFDGELTGNWYDSSLIFSNNLSAIHCINKSLKQNVFSTFLRYFSKFSEEFISKAKERSFLNQIIAPSDGSDAVPFIKSGFKTISKKSKKLNLWIDLVKELTLVSSKAGYFTPNNDPSRVTSAFIVCAESYRIELLKRVLIRNEYLNFKRAPINQLNNVSSNSMKTLVLSEFKNFNKKEFYKLNTIFRKIND